MRREYQGAAPAAQILFNINATDASITCSDLTGWPTGVSGRPFYVVIDRDTPTEEKILCGARNGNILSVYNDGITDGRGADDTSPTSHTSGSVIEHIFTATDADEANAHVNTPHSRIYYQTLPPTSPNTGDMWARSNVIA